MSPRRNDACPCGSGRKYKVCCGAQVLAGSAWTSADTQLALDTIQRFARREEFALAYRAWVARSWSTAPDGVEPELFERSELGDFLEFNLRNSFCLESTLANGARPIEILLERKPKKLSTRVLNCLAALSRTRVDLYRVTHVGAGCLRLAGTRAPDEVEVEQTSETGDGDASAVGGWIACRVLHSSDSKGHVVGEMFPFPSDFDAQALRTALAAAEIEGARASAEREERVAQLVLAAFLEAQFKAAVAMAEQTPSGGATFEVLETAELVRALDDCEELFRDQLGHWAWFGEDGEDASDQSPPRASLVLIGDLFEVIVFEEEHVEPALRFVDELVGDLLRPADDDEEDESDGGVEDGEGDGENEASTSLELRDVELFPARSITQLLDLARSSFREWAEKPLAHLGGRSLRQASADAGARSDVERVLELAATSADERDEVALRWMRGELGLD